MRNEDFVLLQNNEHVYDHVATSRAYMLHCRMREVWGMRTLSEYAIWLKTTWMVHVNDHVAFPHGNINARAVHASRLLLPAVCAFVLDGWLRSFASRENGQ